MTRQKERAVRCGHAFLSGSPVMWRCSWCGETIPFGPSNDSDPAVQVEIFAARLATRRQGSYCTDPEWSGWFCHQEDLDLAFPDGEPGAFSEQAAWLARQIATHQEEP